MFKFLKRGHKNLLIIASFPNDSYILYRMSSIWNYIRDVLCNPDTSISAKLKTLLFEKQKLGR